MKDLIYNLSAFSVLEVGKRVDAEGLPHQEDSLYPQGTTLPSHSRVFVLCDGMGGHDAGEVASSVVCDSLGKTLDLKIKDNQPVNKSVFQESLNVAYSELDSHDTQSAKKMGTTLAAIVFHSVGVLVAHIGDSRVYHIRPGVSEADTQILFQTEDHSLINSLVKAGELTLEEAKKTVKKNVITRAMQPNSERCQADINEISDIKAGDYFYVCSDGMLEQEEMENGTALRRIFSNEVGTTEEKVAILLGATAENRDNHSAWVIKIEDVKTQTEDATPNSFWYKIKSIL